ncbi:MAG TPA: hypothetical protein VKH19_14115 [Gemmatimonadaceae bacterium]|nr:hypothetical protein [Gemmatimonadaceae bacterium]
MTTSARPGTPPFGSYAEPVTATGRKPEDLAAGLRVATYSALILFLELALIRYTAGYVRVFGFYLNFVLIATFLGMGIGLLRADKAHLLKWLAVPASLLLFGAIAFYAEVHIAVPSDPNEFVWSIADPANAGARQVSLPVVVASLFALLSAFFIPLGAQLGANFRKLPGLRAYSYDIAGSLVGILAFGILSALRQPPTVWFALAMTGWVLASIGDRRYAVALVATGLCVVGMSSWMKRGAEYWSPYYRINVTRPEPQVYRVDVNDALHQAVLDLDSARAETYHYARIARFGYVRPYAYARSLDTVLVVGAGTGNDLALLLQRGAKYIDAVEIDPVIADIGAAVHFQQPYANPRVHLHVDDARAFLRKTARSYDAIVFGTLDSQTLLSGMSSVRLDNYVYTKESFAAARSRLKPSGTLIVYHLSGDPYIAAKIYQMVGDAFGSPPGVFGDYMNLFNYTFVAGNVAHPVPVAPDSVMTRLRTSYPEARDDWPYLYLRGRTLPGHYAVALISLLLIAATFVGIAGGRDIARGVDGAMFFMGAGFLLVETKSVTEMSLLFGSTWTVNLLVFSSILAMVLLANVWVRRRPPGSTKPLFVGLFAALAAAYVVPVSSLLWLGTAGQWLLGGVMVALPIFFASMIFSTLLGSRAEPARALAYNLLGAIVGGVLEYSSMIVGIKGLYIVAALLYLGALMLSARRANVAQGIAH